MLDPNVEFGKVEKRYSVGTIHRAHEKWILIVSKEIKKTSEKRKAAKRRQAEDEAKAAQSARTLQDKQTSINRLEKKEQKTLTRLSNLEQSAVSAAENTAKLQEEEKKVMTSLEKLYETGYTEENLDRIILNDAQDSSELLQRIQTKTQFIELCEEKDLVEEQVFSTVQQLEKEKKTSYNPGKNSLSSKCA